MVTRAELRRQIDQLKDEMASLNRQINFLVNYIMDEFEEEEYEGPEDGSYPDVYDSLDSFAS